VVPFLRLGIISIHCSDRHGHANMHAAARIGRRPGRAQPAWHSAEHLACVVFPAKKNRKENRKRPVQSEADTWHFENKNKNIINLGLTLINPDLIILIKIKFS
jgi:hypothetical protein